MIVLLCGYRLLFTSHAHGLYFCSICYTLKTFILNKFHLCDLVSSFNLFIIYKRVTLLILFVLLLHTVMLAIQLQKGVCNLVLFQVVFMCTYLTFQQHSEFFRGINLKENNVCQSLLSLLHVVVTFKICVLTIHALCLACLNLVQ